MGASNVAAAYVLYAGKVPPLSMVCLTYMANVSLDDDPSPWFGQGHAALATGALGRRGPVRRPDIKAVERAIQHLLDVKAIVADRRANGNRPQHQTVRYRLQLGAEALFDRPPESGGRPEGAVPRKVGKPSPEIRAAVPRNPAYRPPISGGLRSKRNHEELQEEQGVDIRTDVTVPAHLRIRRARIA